MEDGFLPETPDTTYHQLALRNTRKIGWDDDFEVETRNNSPRRPKLSTLRRRDVREEIWDDELKLEAKRDDLDAEFGCRDEEDRTVTARSPYASLSRSILRRRHHPCRSSPLITNAHRLNLSFVLQ
jgi:hypothetical protein